MLSKDQIEAIKNSNWFPYLEKHIYSEIKDLDSVVGLDEKTNKDAGEEAKVRLKAMNILMKILGPIVSFNEKKEPSVDDVQRAKKKAGL